MKASLFYKAPILFIFSLTLLFAKLQFNKRCGGDKDVCSNICGDAVGYYAWLPAIFIYNDLNFKFFDTVELKDTVCSRISDVTRQDYRYDFNGKACNKYYPGTSFMMLPFFLAVHAGTKYFSGLAPNGYTYYYYRIMPVSAMFYYFLGMLFFLKILEKIQLTTKQKLLAILFLSFGTNIIYYIIDAPLYSHIYSFALIAAFLFYSFSLKETFSAKNLLCISFITGMIFITRPVNVSVLLVLPFILGSELKTILNKMMQKPVSFIYLLPALIMPAMLCILYKISTGHFFLYSYNNEGFDFLHPHFRQFLFSYDNGVFPYMPLLFMPFLLLFVWYKHEYKSLIIGTFITLVVSMYIHSAWWAWAYGFCFGARTMLDLVPLFGIMIGLSLKQTDTRKYYLLLPVYFLCCALTMVLYQQKSAGHYMGIYPITDYWEAIYKAFGLK